MKFKQYLIGVGSVAVSLSLLAATLTPSHRITVEKSVSEVKISVPMVANSSLNPKEVPVPASSVFTREQSNIRTYITRNFGVDEKGATEVIRHAYELSDETGLHPHLLLAVAAVESGFDPSAQYRGAAGIMQIQASAHRSQIKAMGGFHSLFNVRKNMKLGAEILQDCLARVNNNLRKALLRYNGSSSPSNPYADKVLREKAKMDAAAIHFEE